VKKILIITPLIASLQLFAQPSVGVTAGLNLPWQHFKFESGKTHFNILPNFNAGLVGDIPLPGKFSFQPLLLVSGKGGQATATAPNNITTRRKINVYYLELPLIVNYAIVTKDYKILLGAGPAFDYGIAGKDRTYIDNSLALDFDAFEYSHKRFDAGIFCQAAFRKKPARMTRSDGAIQASAFCNFGVTNIFWDDNPNNAPSPQKFIWKNSVVGISLAYLLPLGK